MANPVPWKRASARDAGPLLQVRAWLETLNIWDKISGQLHEVEAQMEYERNDPGECLYDPTRAHGLRVTEPNPKTNLHAGVE